MKILPLLAGLLVGALAPLSFGQIEDGRPQQPRRVAPAQNVRPRLLVNQANQARVYSRGQNFRPVNPGAAAAVRSYRQRALTNYNSNSGARAWAGRPAEMRRRVYGPRPASDFAAVARSEGRVGNRRGGAGNGNNYQGRGSGQNAGANVTA
ncbi:MAG: hypothetical protein ABI992_10955, partial [Chthoniobacterales bacterium]